MAETLRGTIESVIFHNPENGFSVLRVREEGRREDAVVVGNLAGALGRFSECKKMAIAPTQSR